MQQVTSSLQWAIPKSSSGKSEIVPAFPPYCTTVRGVTLTILNSAGPAECNSTTGVVRGNHHLMGNVIEKVKLRSIVHVPAGIKIVRVENLGIGGTAPAAALLW